MTDNNTKKKIPWKIILLGFVIVDLFVSFVFFDLGGGIKTFLMLIMFLIGGKISHFLGIW